MKILWLTNVPLSKVKSKISNNLVQTGGWLDGMSDELLKKEDIVFKTIFPYVTKEVIYGQVDNIDYVAYPNKFNDSETKILFNKIIEEFNPDLIHVFGTEFKHSLNMMEVCCELNLLDKVIINIQGLCSKISQSYFSGLPHKLIHSFTFRDFIKQDNIYQQKKKFEKRGESEIKALELAKNVIGRTDWDKACVKQINPDLNYFHCDATLRNSFYKDKWNYENCEKFSIFVTQSSYPIKGFHKLLEAMPLILKQYPDAKIYTTGKNLLNLSFIDKLKLSSYQKYLLKLIKKNKLQEHIEFLGMLNEENIKQRYLKSNCFVLSSSIENESNALGEAMILGVPCVSSYCGGVTSRFIHKQDGYMYPFDEEYMLAHYVCKIFEDKECEEITRNAQIYAKNCYDKKQNIDDLLLIYKKLLRRK